MAPRLTPLVPFFAPNSGAWPTASGAGAIPAFTINGDAPFATLVTALPPEGARPDDPLPAPVPRKLAPPSAAAVATSAVPPTTAPWPPEETGAIQRSVAPDPQMLDGSRADLTPPASPFIAPLLVGRTAPFRANGDVSAGDVPLPDRMYVVAADTVTPEAAPASEPPVPAPAPVPVPVPVPAVPLDAIIGNRVTPLPNLPPQRSAAHLPTLSAPTDTIDPQGVQGDGMAPPPASHDPQIIAAVPSQTPPVAPSATVAPTLTVPVPVPEPVPDPLAITEPMSASGLTHVSAPAAPLLSSVPTTGARITETAPDAAARPPRSAVFDAPAPPVSAVDLEAPAPAPISAPPAIAGTSLALSGGTAETARTAKLQPFGVTAPLTAPAIPADRTDGAVSAPSPAYKAGPDVTATVLPAETDVLAPHQTVPPIAATGASLATTPDPKLHAAAILRPDGPPGAPLRRGDAGPAVAPPVSPLPVAAITLATSPPSSPLADPQLAPPVPATMTVERTSQPSALHIPTLEIGGPAVTFVAAPAQIPDVIADPASTLDQSTLGVEPARLAADASAATAGQGDGSSGERQPPPPAAPAPLAPTLAHRFDVMAAPLSSPPVAPPVAPPILARAGMIGSDVGVAIVRHADTGSGDVLVIHLDPVELGRIEVRLTVDAQRQLSADVSADQRATLDLLRRDADSLTRALADAGFSADDQSLTFDQRGSGHSNPEPHPPRRPSRYGYVPQDDRASAPPTLPVRVSDRIDLVA